MHSLLRRACPVIAAIVFTLVFQPLASSALEIEDVPETHWAYESVEKLVEEGYMTLYADKTFRGEEAVDRYTLATIIAKMLREIEEGAVTPTEEDVDTLRKLSTEFRDELVEIASETDLLAERVEKIEDQDEILQTRQAETRDEVSTLAKDVDDILDHIRESADRQQELTDRLASLEDQVQQVEVPPEIEEDAVAQLTERDAEREERLQALEERVDNIHQEVVALHDAQEEVQEARARDSNMPLYALGAVVFLLLIAQ